MNTQPVAQKKNYSFQIHNQTIIDEYHWLRDTSWPDVRDKEILTYLEEENKYFEEYFVNDQNTKEQIFQELKGRIKLTDMSPYVKDDNYYYYSRTEEDKEYPIYCRKFGSIEAKEEIILDVNELSKDRKYISVGSISVSPNHELLAYSVDFNGDEKYTIRILNLKTQTYLDDEIKDTIGGIVWHETIGGFFYTPTNDNWRCDKIIFHRLGEKEDKLILEELNSLYQLSVSKSSSDEYIFLDSGGHDCNEIYLISMQDPSLTPKLIRKKRDTVLYDVDHNGEFFYIHTNDSAKNFRIIRIAVNGFADNDWVDYISEESEQYLSSFDITQNYLILNYKQLALPLIKVQNLSDKQVKIIEFPDQAFSAGSSSTNFKEDDIRVGYSSLSRPSTTYSYDFLSSKLSILKIQEIPSGFNSDDYMVERIFADSSGVKVPITLFYKKSLFKKDGSNPLYLYGYGSYGYGMPVGFRNSAVSIADRGFIFAIAHIRGGDDLGRDWYECAKFLQKQRTFDDFIAVAEKLIDEKYTSRGNIAICGGSAGGLLIGAALNQAPHLFKAAIAHVPFVDVLNTMLDETLPLTPGEFKEWGNPKELEYFEYIKSYSPYDNIKEQAYPALMVSAGLSDPRVGYWEAAKWVAKLRSTKTDNNPIIMKTNMDAGHAGASGRFEYLKEAADDLVFLFKIFKK